MASDKTQPWIAAGYKLFAQEGPAGMKVEVVARKVGKSKSSFYHHFADLEVFSELLLHHHLKRTREIAELEKHAQNLVPDIVNLLVDSKEDLFFHRQLRFHREIPAFRACFEQSDHEVRHIFLALFAREMGLTEKPAAAESMLEMAVENFYLRLTPENLTFDWLADYFRELQTTVAGLQRQAKPVHKPRMGTA